MRKGGPGKRTAGSQAALALLATAWHEDRPSLRPGSHYFHHRVRIRRHQVASGEIVERPQRAEAH
jgi:hypothetical protein